MSRIRVGLLASSAAALVAFSTLVSGSTYSGVGPPSSAESEQSFVAADRSDDHIDRVLAISVDGLNPRAITKLGRSGAPAFHRMMREGAYTFNARTVLGSTSTLPNHSTMLTSRRLDPANGGTGVRFNYDNGGTVEKAAGRYVPSVFDVVHDRGGSTALYSAKAKFRFFVRTWNANGDADRVGKNHGRAKIDKATINGNNHRLVGELKAELNSEPKTLTFLHIALPDSAGHRYGFMSARYLDAVKATDRLLGSLLATVAAKPSLRERTLVVLTADHGGDGKGHGDPADLQNYRIPFMVWGRGVPAGRDLYAINPAFKTPGASRPGYQGKQPIRNAALGNLATDVLDMPALGGSEFNRAQTLNVF